MGHSPRHIAGNPGPRSSGFTIGESKFRVVCLDREYRPPLICSLSGHPERHLPAHRSHCRKPMDHEDQPIHEVPGQFEASLEPPEAQPALSSLTMAE